MSDAQVSADGQSHRLPQPFMVIATQNPFEFEGTYPLPESQLDRFLLRIAVGYPERDDEMLVLTSHRGGEPVDRLEPVVDPAQILALQDATRQVVVEESISDYLLDIVGATRHSPLLRVGVSTRGALCLYRAAQALAVIENRDYVVPDDVKRLAVPVLAHRVIAKSYHQGEREAVETLIQRLVDDIRAELAAAGHPPEPARLTSITRPRRIMRPPPGMRQPCQRQRAVGRTLTMSGLAGVFAGLSPQPASTGGRWPARADAGASGAKNLVLPPFACFAIPGHC